MRALGLRLVMGDFPMMSTRANFGARTGAKKSLRGFKNGIALAALGFALSACGGMFGYNDYDTAGGITKQDYADLLSRRAPEKQVEEPEKRPTYTGISVGLSRALCAGRFGHAARVVGGHGGNSRPGHLDRTRAQS